MYYIAPLTVFVLLPTTVKPVPEIAFPPSPPGGKIEMGGSGKSWLKMVPKIDTIAKVDFGWPKWYQKYSKIVPKGIQNLCKIASKVDAKIDAENVSENEAKIDKK